MEEQRIDHIWACFCRYDLPGTGFSWDYTDTTLRLFLIQFTPRIDSESPAGIICGRNVCSSQPQYWRRPNQHPKKTPKHIQSLCMLIENNNKQTNGGRDVYSICCPAARLRAVIADWCSRPIRDASSRVTGRCHAEGGLNLFTAGESQQTRRTRQPTTPNISHAGTQARTRNPPEPSDPYDLPPPPHR